MRNPWGSSTYSGDWNKNDAYWSDSTISNVPLGIDPRTSDSRGIFVIDVKEFINGRCFADYEIGHLRDDKYVTTWYDATNMDENFHDYFITVPEVKGDLYFTVESYYANVVPKSCTTKEHTYTSNGNQVTSTLTKPLLYFALYQEGVTSAIAIQYYTEQFHRPILRTSYNSGTVFKIAV